MDRTSTATGWPMIAAQGRPGTVRHGADPGVARPCAAPNRVGRDPLRPASRPELDSTSASLRAPMRFPKGRQ